MTRTEIDEICRAKADSLLEKYFGELVKEASIVKPETIGEYDMNLPLRIEEEYKEYLKILWNKHAGDDTRTFDEIIDKPELREALTADDREALSYAYHDAQRRTLWERLTKSNHRDVTFYKGLLEEYTRELLFCLRHDFVEEFKD